MEDGGWNQEMVTTYCVQYGTSTMQSKMYRSNNRLLFYLLFLLSNACLSNLFWIFHWSSSLSSTTTTTTTTTAAAFSSSFFLSPINSKTSSSVETAAVAAGEAAKATIHRIPSTKDIIIQAFVISSRKKSMDDFLKRNQGILISSDAAAAGGGGDSDSSPIATVTWFPAMNGYDQIVLNEYAQLTGFLPPLNATRFRRLLQKEQQQQQQPHGGGYETPHHFGCFMSHWHLLRLALEGWKATTTRSMSSITTSTTSTSTRPDALWVLEEDATCAATTLQEIQHRILPSLPQDWDLLYVGGKPFSYHTLDPLSNELLLQEKKENENRRMTNIQKDWTRHEFRQWACRGGLGRSATGPFSPDNTRNLSLTEQPYWKTRYITNTHAYLVNPQRIERVLYVLEHPTTRDYPVPVDIALAEAGQRGELNIFMSTMEFCIQEPRDQQDQDITATSISKKNDKNKKKKQQPRQQRPKPTPWQGLYYHKDLAGRRVDEIFFAECPNKP